MYYWQKTSVFCFSFLAVFQNSALAASNSFFQTSSHMLFRHKVTFKIFKEYPLFEHFLLSNTPSSIHNSSATIPEYFIERMLCSINRWCVYRLPTPLGPVFANAPTLIRIFNTSYVLFLYANVKTTIWIGKRKSYLTECESQKW